MEVVACFETLCGVRAANNLKILASLLSVEESQFINECNWSVAKNWAQWWSRREHLKMLFTSTDRDTWDKCSSTTNAVERKNKDCKSDSPQCLKLAMLKVYKVDKVACLRHIAAEDHVSLSYRSRDTDAVRVEAARKQKQRQKDTVAPDKSAQFGLPDSSDRASNFDTRKRKSPAQDLQHRSKRKHVEVLVNSSVVELIPNPHPEVNGKTVRMKFHHAENGLKG